MYKMVLYRNFNKVVVFFDNFCKVSVIMILIYKNMNKKLRLLID